eukprot:TRINITY_DN120142_c0_g1_i1.p1 TRINITY_DN120142_c0_g1~~TRINITY_DN120142_c0_g1_i1.p1  ORF type:complete len:1278 (-),score=116.15 TRINITY_DN120142_c0_g1_i1:4048-7881(-)
MLEYHVHEQQQQYAKQQMDNPLKTSMYSRLGKSCNELTVKLDKSQNIFNEPGRNPKFTLRESRLLGKKQESSNKTTVELSSMFRYYQSMERERKETLEKQKKLEQWKQGEALLLRNDPNTQKKKPMDPEFLKQSAAFKAPARKPMGYDDVAVKKPNIGQYYPRYKCVLSESPQWRIGQSPKVCMFDETAARTLANTGKAFFYDSQKPAIGAAKGYVNFGLQAERKSSFLVGNAGPHESRFEVFDNNPEISSNHKKSRMVSLDRIKGRDQTIFKSTLTGIQYDPKYETVKQRLDKGAVNFGKMNGRVLSLCGSLPYIKNSSNPENVEKYYKKIDRKKSVPQFGKCYSPKEDKNDTLPKFLKGLHNRIGVMIMGPYGLKANNYQNAKFATASSSFEAASAKKLKIKPKKDYDFNLSKTLEENSFVMVNSGVNVAEDPMLEPIAQYTIYWLHYNTFINTQQKHVTERIKNQSQQMEKNVKSGATIMTETPIVVREYTDDVLPKPLKIYLDPYVLHDPSFRGQTLAGSNLAPQSVRESQKSANSLFSLEWNQLTSRTEVHKKDQAKGLEENDALAKFKKDYHYLLEDKDIVIDTKDLAKDKYANLYFLHKNDPQQTIIKSKVLKTRREKAAYFVEKLGVIPEIDMLQHSSSQKDIGQRVIIKKHMPQIRPKSKRMRIQFYGATYDPTRPGKDQVRQQVNSRITYYKTKETKTGNSQKPTTNLTLKTLFDKGDPIKLLSLVSPNRINEKKTQKVSPYIAKKEASPSKKQPCDTLKTTELEKKHKKDLIAKYAHKTLDCFASPRTARKLSDMPEIFQDVVNWGLAKTYEKIRSPRKSALGSYEIPGRMGIGEVQEKLFKKLERIEGLSSAIRPQSIMTERPYSVVSIHKETPVNSIKARHKHITDLLSTKDSAVDVYSLAEKYISSFGSDTCSRSSSLSARNSINTCTRCASKHEQYTTEKEFFVTEKEGRLLPSKDVVEIKRSVAQAKEKAKRMIKDVCKYTHEEKNKAEPFSGLTPRDLETALHNKDTNTEKLLEKYQVVEKLLRNNKEALLQKGYKIKILKRDKAKNKPPLDNKVTSLEDKFKTKVSRERIDAAFSKIFHEKSKAGYIPQNMYYAIIYQVIRQSNLNLLGRIQQQPFLHILQAIHLRQYLSKAFPSYLPHLQNQSIYVVVPIFTLLTVDASKNGFITPHTIFSSQFALTMQSLCIRSGQQSWITGAISLSCLRFMLESPAPLKSAIEVYFSTSGAICRIASSKEQNMNFFILSSVVALGLTNLSLASKIG